MKAIHIQTTISSKSLHLPELKPFIGTNVEIIIQPAGTKAPADWLPGFWDNLSIGWQGEPLTRPEQGVCERRDPLR